MKPPIVLIIAMESERRHLDGLLPGWEKVESEVWPALRNGDLICITCGIGMISAAAATEHAIATYNPGVIVNYGCAGSHSRDLYPGDVVVGNRLVHHGRIRFAADRNIIPLDGNFTVPGEVTKVGHLATDVSLAKLAIQVALETELPIWPKEFRLVDQPKRAPMVHMGTVSSGDIWLQDAERIDAGQARTGSLCEDMEAAAIAQICAMHRVPFLTVKDISNNEFHAVTVFEGRASALPSDEVGLRASIVVAGLIRRLQSNGDVT